MWACPTQPQPVPSSALDERKTTKTFLTTHLNLPNNKILSSTPIDLLTLRLGCYIPGIDMSCTYLQIISQHCRRVT